MREKTTEMEARRQGQVTTSENNPGEFDLSAAEHFADQSGKDELWHEQQLNSKTNANLPPDVPKPEVTLQEVQQFRMAHQSLREAPDEQIRALIQQLKIQRMRRASAVVRDNRLPVEQLETHNVHGDNPLQHPRAQMIMNNMDVPHEVIQMVPGLPPNAKNLKWGHLSAWISGNKTAMSDYQKQALRSLQLNQFESKVLSHDQGGARQQPESTKTDASELPRDL